MSSHNSAPLNSVKYILRWGAEHIGISWYLESKLMNSKNFIGTYFGHMVTISDLGAGPQSRPLPLVYLSFGSAEF